jgi:hypothetical protein
MGAASLNYHGLTILFFFLSLQVSIRCAFVDKSLDHGTRIVGPKIPLDFGWESKVLRANPLGIKGKTRSKE